MMTPSVFSRLGQPRLGPGLGLGLLLAASVVVSSGCVAPGSRSPGSPRGETEFEERLPPRVELRKPDRQGGWRGLFSRLFRRGSPGKLRLRKKEDGAAGVLSAEAERRRLMEEEGRRSYDESRIRSDALSEEQVAHGGGEREWNTGPPEPVPYRWNAAQQLRDKVVMRDDAPGSAQCIKPRMGPECLLDHEIRALQEGRTTLSLDRARARGYVPTLEPPPELSGVLQPRRAKSLDPPPSLDSAGEFLRVPKKGDTWWGYGSELSLTYQQMADLNHLDYREVAQGKHLTVGKAVRLSRSMAGRGEAFRKKVVQQNTELSHRYDGARVREALRAMKAAQGSQTPQGVARHPSAVKKPAMASSGPSVGKPGAGAGAGAAQGVGSTGISRAFGSRGKPFDLVASRYGYNSYLELRNLEEFNLRVRGGSFLDLDSGRLLKDLLIPSDAALR